MYIMKKKMKLSRYSSDNILKLAIMITHNIRVTIAANKSLDVIKVIRTWAEIKASRVGQMDSHTKWIVSLIVYLETVGIHWTQSILGIPKIHHSTIDHLDLERKLTILTYM